VDTAAGQNPPPTQPPAGGAGGGGGGDAGIFTLLALLAASRRRRSYDRLTWSGQVTCSDRCDAPPPQTAGKAEGAASRRGCRLGLSESVIHGPVSGNTDVPLRVVGTEVPCAETRGRELREF